MRKIVDDQYAAHFSLHVHAPLHTAKRRKRFGNERCADSPSVRHGHRRHRIQGVVLSSRGQRKFTKRCSPMLHSESHHVAFHRKFLRLPVISPVKSIRLHRAECFFGCPPQRWSRFFRVAPNHDSTAPRHKIHQPAERQLVSLKIRANVRVIVFERSNDQIILGPRSQKAVSYSSPSRMNSSPSPSP